MDLIQDEQSFLSATVRGHKTRVWDEGFGPLWIYRETMGVTGIVRAASWEEAHECVVDEIMDDADGDDPDTWGEKGELSEGCYFRNNGVPAQDGLESAIAQEDLNGSRLDRLTAELAEELGVELELK